MEYGLAIGVRLPAVGYRLGGSVRGDHAREWWRESCYKDRTRARSSKLVVIDGPRNVTVTTLLLTVVDPGQNGAETAFPHCVRHRCTTGLIRCAHLLLTA